MQKWVELGLAGVIGAVVPALGGVWWISHVDTKIEELRTSLPEKAELTARRLVEAQLNNVEKLKQLSEDINQAENLTSKAASASEAASEEARRLQSSRVELNSKIEELVKKADLSLSDTSQTLEAAIQNPSFQNAVVDKVKVPSGAIFAFDLESGCPDGWTDFSAARGRMITGATPDGGNSEGLTPRKWQSRGGEEVVTLSPDQMPVHSHRLGVDPGSDYQGVALANYHGSYGGVQTEETGGGKSHNNMPPYIALYFCKKN